MKIAIYRNRTKEDSAAIFDRITLAIDKEGASWYEVTDETSLAPSTDCFIVIGGDGTILTKSSLAYLACVPVWAVNAGTLGFLAESPLGLEQKVARLVSGDYRLLNRGVIAVSCEGHLFEGINDVCVSRGAAMQTLHISVNAVGHQIYDYRGDGMVVATPTGSTGYSLSAGGPVLSPEAEALILTPVCPHSFGVRPVVLKEDSLVKVRADCLSDGVVTVDGIAVHSFQQSIEFTVTKSNRSARFICLEEVDFFQKLEDKLNSHRKVR